MNQTFEAFFEKKFWKIFLDSPENFLDSPENFQDSPENFLDKSRKFSARRTCTYFIYWKMTSTSVVSSTSDIFFHFLKFDDSAI